MVFSILIHKESLLILKFNSINKTHAKIPEQKTYSTLRISSQRSRHRHRSWYHQLLCCPSLRKHSQSHLKCRGKQNHSLCCCHHQRRIETCWSSRQETSHHQLRKHSLCFKKIDRKKIR